MSITRRDFFNAATGLGAVAITGGAWCTHGAPASGGTPRLRIGVLSDVHINANALEKTAGMFRKALEYFRDRGVDGVIVAGDIADTGRLVELEAVGAAWRAVFPGNEAPDGRRVEKVFLYGNHDTYQKADDRAQFIAADRAAAWEKCFDEKYEPIYAKKLKGITFICAHWDCEKLLPDFLARMADDLGKQRPFFYAQHPHPRNTCFGSWAWGCDNGTTTRALSQFPNAVAFSGHSHYSLTDERNVWQGAFTSIGTSSLSYSSLDYNYRENSAMGSRKDRRPLRMGRLNTSDGKQGMVMSVFDDRIVLERREFVFNQGLGDDWIIPLPVPTPGSSPFDYARRAAGRVVPEFQDDAKVTVELNEKEKTLAVKFPAALTREKCRVFEYEVSAVLEDEDVALIMAQRLVLAPDSHLPETQAGRPGHCIFALADLPAGAPLRFTVRPMECFGRKGASIHSDLITTPQT